MFQRSLSASLFLGALRAPKRTLRKRASWVALACGLASCSAPSQSLNPAGNAVLDAEGAHSVQSVGDAQLVRLKLKSGFAVGLAVSAKREQVGPVRLQVAEPRAASEQIAVGFVPVGPTVALSLQSPWQGGSLEVSFAADGFHVRSGHRLVLAVERALPCESAEPCGNWQIEPAVYRDGRCVAELTAPGLRLQFGSLPGALSGSAAP